jgi:hypothetical protein
MLDRCDPKHADWDVLQNLEDHTMGFSTYNRFLAGNSMYVRATSKQWPNASEDDVWKYHEVSEGCVTLRNELYWMYLAEKDGKLTIQNDPYTWCIKRF